jgi:hypothetical protein
MRFRGRLRLLPFLSILGFASPALATDGMLEINQTCAVQTGCFPSDEPGFPITITQAGSYRLTSNLFRSSSLGGAVDSNVIEVLADDVSLDLGGFRIFCQTLLGGRCSGSGSGIEADPSTVNTWVRNGSIRGMGTAGVKLGVRARVNDLGVRSNGNHGISVSSTSTVSGCLLEGNGAYGVLAGPGSIVTGNAAHDNGSDGFHVQSGSTVSGNTAWQNGGHGFDVDLGSTISENSAMQNEKNGIDSGLDPVLVIGNTLRANTGYGLNIGSGAAYRENLIDGNAMGTVTGGVNAGGNVCNGSLTCP